MFCVAGVGATALAAGCPARAASAGGQAVEGRVVDAFIGAYQALDAKALLALLVDDVYFEDPTFHLQAKNKEEMRPIVESLATNYRAVRVMPFNRILVAPWAVSQQRIAATIVKKDGQAREVDVRGVSMFEIRGGKIARWYDYYDVLTFQEQTR